MSDETLENAPEETPSPAPAPTPQPAVRAPLTDEAIIGLVQRAVAPLAAEVAAIKQGITPKAAPATEKDAVATAKVRGFAEDPDTFLDTEVTSRTQKILDERVAPGMVTMLENQRESHLEAERQRIDGIAGPGFFDKEILPMLFEDPLAKKGGALGTNHLYGQANKTVVRAVVDGIFGHKVATNPDNFTEAVSKRQAAERQAQEAPAYWGPGGPPPMDPNGRLPRHIREAITQANEAGAEITEEDYRLSKSAGKTLDGWMAAQKQKDAAAKRAAH